MFADRATIIIDAILAHTINNDVKFQGKKLKAKMITKKFRSLSDTEQEIRLYELIQEVRLGFDTVKKAKLKATDMIYSILKEKLSNGCEGQIE